MFNTGVWFSQGACQIWKVGANKQRVYGGGRYDMNISFLKYCCLVKKGCCLVKKGYPNHHGH